MLSWCWNEFEVYVIDKIEVKLNFSWDKALEMMSKSFGTEYIGRLIAVLEQTVFGTNELIDE